MRILSDRDIPGPSISDILADTPFHEGSATDPLFYGRHPLDSQDSR